MFTSLFVTLSAGALASASALPRASILYPHDIQGPGFISPYVNKTISNLQGVVTANSSSGYYLQTPSTAFDDDDRTSEAVFAYATLPASVKVGDLIQIASAKVSEYAGAATNLKTTELGSVSGVTVVTAGVGADPVVLGSGAGQSLPPTEYVGIENPFQLPANTTNIEVARASSLNLTFGTDFWESLEGMLVTVPNPTALFRPDTYNEVYVVSDTIGATSRNSRGGITLAGALDSDGSVHWDANPEAILIGSPLDSTKNPKTILLGDTLSNITGVVSYSFGSPILYPLTALHVIRKADPTVPPTNLTSSGSCSSLLVGTYNVENLDPSATTRIKKIGSHIDTLLNNPDVLVFNEIQDADGSKDSGTVSANKTLDAIVASISKATYKYLVIDPVNDQDGGEPGGNIRPAIVYRPDRMTLVPGLPYGNSTAAVDVTKGSDGKAKLTLNPGRIDPSNAAWNSSRKPIVAQFTLNDGTPLFVIGAHFASKIGSSEPYGPTQAPSNGAVQQRITQGQVVRDFVGQILKVQADAKVVLLGDFNEFSYVQPLATLTSNVSGGSSPSLTEILPDERVERYSYIYEGNSQQIDHIFTTPAIAAAGKPVAEIVHANNWGSLADAASDHDPIVGSLNVC